MAEYRLDDLARLSGVSARNIRAYRERGLLDPPRRIGRSAYYGEAHLAQLRAISQLLGKGFNSTHIAEFFSGLRSGQDLAGVLGIERTAVGRPAGRLEIGADDDDGRALVELGLAAAVDGVLELTDPGLAAIVAGADNPRLCLRTVVLLAQSTDAAVAGVAELVVSALAECLAVESESECYELARTVVADRVAGGLDRALQRRRVG